MKNKNIFYIALATAFILLIPLVAMQFTDEVNWDLFDFAFMGALLFGTGLAYELLARKMGNRTYRVAVGVALAGAFLLFWVNGAVGIIGNEGNPANLLYFGVLAVGIIGALIARFRPYGMARALFAAAFAQALVPVVALLIWPPPATSWAPSVFRVFVLNAFFVALFVLSGLLFKRASTTAPTMPKNITDWIFAIVFFVIGILNVFLVHPVPGVFYLLLSFFYFPPASVILKKRFGFRVPYVVKIILGLVILWVTLAVGDLAEILGL